MLKTDDRPMTPVPSFGPSPFERLMRRSGPDIPASPVVQRAGLVAVLVALLVAGDWLLWQTAHPALALAIMALGIGGAAVLLRGKIGAMPLGLASAALIFGVLPVIEVVNPLTVLLAMGGMLTFAAILTGARPFILPFLMIRDYFSAAGSLIRQTLGPMRDTGTISKRALNWIMPLGLGLVFLGLFALANPVLETWLTSLDRWLVRLEGDPDRVAFWIILAVCIWPFLALWRISLRVQVRSKQAAPLWFFNAASVQNALILFNALFALQTLTDAAYLWGGASLPDGMTYAEYAHRGAYPLVATALLAGLFAVLAYRWTAERPVIRWLLLAWVLQNVVLVASSVLRLDLYVSAYGLTIFRVSAFVWMGLVAGGLALMAVQLMWHRSVAWLLSATAVMATLVLYSVSFVNVPALVARTNLDLADTVEVDWRYLCNLGEEAAVALADTPCHISVATPEDWREWGYRNARIRGILAAGEDRTHGPDTDRR